MERKDFLKSGRRRGKLAERMPILLSILSQIPELTAVSEMY